MALSTTFLSMVGMELAENATDYFLTGGVVPVSPIPLGCSRDFDGGRLLRPAPIQLLEAQKARQSLPLNHTARR